MIVNNIYDSGKIELTIRLYNYGDEVVLTTVNIAIHLVRFDAEFYVLFDCNCV